MKTRWASYGNNESAGLQVTGSAFGLGADLGAIVPLTETASLGLAGRDILSVLNWDSSAAGSYEENVPAALVLGVALAPREELVFEVDLDKALHTDNSDIVRAGIELVLFDVAAVRGGYATALPDTDREEYSLGAGARVRAGNTIVSVDLAYLFGKLEDTLRLSLGLGL